MLLAVSSLLSNFKYIKKHKEKKYFKRKYYPLDSQQQNMIRRSSVKSEMQQDFSHKKQQDLLLELKLKNRSSYKQSPKLNKRQSLRIKREQKEDKQKQGEMKKMKTNQMQDQKSNKQPDKSQSQNKSNNKEKKISQKQIPNKNQKEQQKQQIKGESKKNEKQQKKQSRQKFQLYIKTKFPYQYSSTYTFPNRQKQEAYYDGDAVIHYVDSIQSFFAYEKVLPFFYGQTKQQLGQISAEDRKQRYRKMNKEKRQSQQKKQLKYIQSVFMTSKNVHLSENQNKDMPLKLVQKIRQHNKEAKICIEVDKFYTEYPKNRESIERDFKQYDCVAMKTNFDGDYKTLMKQSDRAYRDFKTELKKNLQNIQKYPLFFERPKTIFQQYCFHTKIWLIKFNNKQKKVNKVRIIISTANIDDFWEDSTNIFWVKQFPINDLQGPPLKLDPNPKYYDKYKQLNTNQDFIDTLKNVVFEKQQKQWHILQSLDIKLDRIQVKDINFVLIPSRPTQNFMPDQNQSGFSQKIALKKIQKYTKIYFQNNPQLLQKKYQCRLYVLTPNYLKCNREFISKIQKTFFCQRLKREQLTNQVILMYPSNKYIYKRIYKDSALGNKQERILKGYFAFKQNQQKLPYPPLEHVNNVNNLSNNQTEIRQESQNKNKRVFFRDYSRQINNNHRNPAYKDRRTWDFSFPHLKACFINFRQQKENIRNRSIFYFGSHNFTPAAWQNCQPNTNDNGKKKFQFRKGNKYQYTIFNNQLGLLFFDFPGFLNHVLPLQICFSKNSKLNYNYYIDNQEMRQNLRQGRFTLYKKGYYNWKKDFVKPQQQLISQFKRMFQKYLKDFQNERCDFDYPIVQGQFKFCQYLPNITIQSCFEKDEQLFMSADIAVWNQVGSRKYIKKIYFIKTQFHKTTNKNLCKMTRNYFSQPHRGYLQFYHFIDPKEFIRIYQTYLKGEELNKEVIQQKIDKCINRIL